MSNLITLLKIDIINTIGINKLKSIDKKDKVKNLSFVGIILLSIIILSISVFELCILLSDMLIQINQMELLLVMGVIGCVCFSLFNSIYKVPSYLYSSKDIEMLGSLPIKDSTILKSKLIMIILSNYLYSFLFMIIPAIVYFIKVKPSFIFILNLLVMFVMTPLIPIIIASIIAYFLGKVSAKSKYKNTLLIIGSLVIVLFIIVLSYNMEYLMEGIVNKSSSIIEMTKNIYPPAYYFVDGLKNNNFISVIVFVLISVIPFIIFVSIFSKDFRRINSKMNESYKIEGYNIKELKESSVVKTLLKKEFKRYFSSYSYVLNTIIGPVILGALAIWVVLLGQEKLSLILQLSSSTDIFNMQITLIIIFCIMLSCTTNSSISLEGKNIWILKSSPISEIDIFKSKVYMNLLLILPMSLISLLIIAIKLKFTLKYTFIMSIMIILCSIFISLYGLYINLMYPKLDFINDIEIVKRSLSTMITIFSAMAYIGIAIGLYYILKINNFNNFLIIVTFIIGIVDFILLKLIKTKGIVMFKRI